MMATFALFDGLAETLRGVEDPFNNYWWCGNGSVAGFNSWRLYGLCVSLYLFLWLICSQTLGYGRRYLPKNCALEQRNGNKRSQCVRSTLVDVSPALLSLFLKPQDPPKSKPHLKNEFKS